MPNRKDIFRSAQLLIKQHGQEAEGYATNQLKIFRERGDKQAVSVWFAIIEAIKTLQTTESSGSLH
ncbi:MAG TPA: hypothetical protein VFT64_05860 [Rickettsiales bacterium]|nr:hypothetical protein [Rickettsiales bacterium]